ncbi:MAG: hypothetical protein NC253_09040 [Ruminococcus sp.]|nr:hypothetical protein [Ruminococcus sp.]MCM1478389.1 hypothetical protein [Muribaculaceae bacterium]
MNSANKKGLKLYETEIEVLLSLDEKPRSKIMTAVLCKCVGREIPELDPIENAIFTLIYGQVERAAELSEKRRNSINSRWKNNENTSGIQNGTKHIQS